MKTMTYHVPDIHCASCIMRLEGLEDDLPGVKQVRVSLHRKQMRVEFDERQITEQYIRQAIITLGYTTQLPTDESLENCHISQT